MDNLQIHYEIIEANLRQAMGDAKQIGDDLLAYLIKIALLETYSKILQDMEEGGETSIRRDC